MKPAWKLKRPVLDGRQMRRVIRRMANEIVEIHRGGEDLLLVGIRTRGVPLAERLRDEIRDSEGLQIPVGILDITLYRDDLSTVGPHPLVKSTQLPGKVDGLDLVLCDDVLFTGRTIRAALDAVVDFGRPRSVRLAVLIDRTGHREVPIQGDVVGKRVSTGREEHVDVHFRSTDGDDKVQILEPA